MILYRLALSKGFDASVAVGAEQDADGDIQLLVELMGKRKREGGKPARATGFFPAFLGSGLLLWIEGGHGVDVDFADGNILLG